MNTENPTKYKNDFQKEKYDRIIVFVEKGKKEEIEKYRIKKNFKSLNSYINTLIEEDMKKTSGGMDQIQNRDS